MNIFNKVTIILLLLVTVTSCKNSEFIKENISIIDQKNHFKITIDYTDNTDYRRTGKILGEGILKMIPDYEQLVDSYIYELTGHMYQVYLFQVQFLLDNLHSNYKLELEGIASSFSGKESIANDGKLSLDEFLFFNFLADIIPRTMACSFIGINNEASYTGDTILSRNLEWYNGNEQQLTKIQTITEFKTKNINTVSIGYAGIMGIVTGVNDQKLFTGILDSPIKSTFSSKGKTPYILQLRYALENSSTIEEMVEYMNGGKEYKLPHLLVISDDKESIVLENFPRSADSGGLQSEARRWDSELYWKVTWDIKNSIAAVNSFLLPELPHNYYTTHDKVRLETIQTKLKEVDGLFQLSDLKNIATTKSISPAKTFKNGDIYNSFSQQIILYRPETFEAQIFFFPKNNKYIPDNPKFENIIFFE